MHIDADLLKPAIENMLRVNLGLRAGEKLLVVGDEPLAGGRENAAERLGLAKLVAATAEEAFPDVSVRFHSFVPKGVNGAEPDDVTAGLMTQADVLVLLTSYSLSHTHARSGACAAGGRVASMPGFTPTMFAPGGPMDADYNQIAADSQRFADRLNAADHARVVTAAGTDIRFSVAGRSTNPDTGLLTEPGLFGNLPAGEAYIAPVEGSAEGVLIVPAGWYAELEEPMAFHFHAGLVTEIDGGDCVGDYFRKMLFEGDSPEHIARRNLAELGVGTNPNAADVESVLEAEKIAGTVHLAIGDSAHFGGQTSADLHQDFILPKPDLYLDETPVIAAGQWIIA